MALYSYVVLTQATAGREAEFDRWYDEQHLVDVARVRGVASARRFNIVRQDVRDLDVPKWRSLAIYEIEADNLDAANAVIDAIVAVAGTQAMPLTDALDPRGAVMLLAEPSRKSS